METVTAAAQEPRGYLIGAVPFGPWLVAIAKRRIIDRLRRQGRTRTREVALDEEDVTFSAPAANLGEADWNKRVLGDAIPSVELDHVSRA